MTTFKFRENTVLNYDHKQTQLPTRRLKRKEIGEKGKRKGKEGQYTRHTLRGSVMVR